MFVEKVHRYWEGPEGTGLCPASSWPAGTTEWDPSALPAELAASVGPEEDGPRHRANLTRYWLLAERGGMWADHDVWPLDPITTWEPPTSPWVAMVGGLPCLCICGGHGDAWRALLARSLSAPVTDSAASTSGRVRILEAVRAGEVLGVAGLVVGRRVRGAIVRHDWRTSTARQRDRGNVGRGR